MGKAKIFLSMLLLTISTLAFAQKQVSGTVLDSEGAPVPGASVFVDGTNVGTVTDANGQYVLVVKGGDVLKFSFFGMRDETVQIGDKTVIDVTLSEDAIGLDKVVITATGMTRQEKTLGYASTTVRSDEIAKGHAPDALSGLAGKVAGVQISSSGGTGTSQKVIIRGYSSLRSNQPLYVVDGAPITNSTSGSFGLNNSVDFGNSGADVNPEDIESITVLKGASATALYGSRAANGVIIINTKKGLQNEDVKVTYNGSVMASQVLRIPQLQRSFGQGWFYSYDGNLFENYSYTENGSWGNPLDGRTVEWRPGASWYNGADPSYTSFSYKENSLKNFYATGMEYNNNVTIQGGSRSTGFIVSYGNITSDGILPGSGDYYKRHNFSFRGNTKIKDGLAWMNYSMNYIRKDVRNAMAGQGGSGSVIYQDIIQYPANIDYADLKDYNSIYNNADNFYTPYAQNPWWILDHNYAMSQQDRVYGNMEFGLQLLKGLQLIARGGLDVLNTSSKSYNDLWQFSTVSYNADEGASVELGDYSESSSRNTQIDANIFLNADYQLPFDFSVHATGGVNINTRRASGISGYVQGLAIPEYASFDNTTGYIPVASSSVSERRLVGAYMQADLGWKDAIFVSASARNDWSSTLPKPNNSYFYYGLNGSVILTQLIPALQNDVLSFLKLRGGFGQTGNDADPYLTSSYYYMASASGGFGSMVFPSAGYYGFAKTTALPSTDLKPEISTESEIGLDVRFFKNRLGVDVALYNKLTENQIITASLAPESGFTSKVRNVGQIRNKGIEVTLTAVPVQTKNFRWNMAYTFTRNNNVVESLWDDVPSTTIYGLTAGPQLDIVVGEPLGVWRDYMVETVKDENSPYYGKVIVNGNTGYPEISSKDKEILGKADPEFTMGLNNVFSYKNVSLGFSLDWRHGGLMYSATKSIALFTGNDVSTIYNDRDAWVWPNSAVVIGKDAEGNDIYGENNIPVDARYTMNGVHYDNYNYYQYRKLLVDKSYLKLRELNITYKLPDKWFENVKWLSGAEVSLVGRNLLMWTPNQGLIDPDTTNYGNDLTSQFGEFYSAPSVRTFGGSVKIVF